MRKADIAKTASTVLMECLLHAARRLPVDTHVPVKDIAGHPGFGSAADFTCFIQQHTRHSAIEP